MLASRPSNGRQQSSLLSPNTADLFIAGLSTPHPSEFHYGPVPSPKTSSYTYNPISTGAKQAFVPGVGFRPTPHSQQQQQPGRRPSGASAGSAFSPTSVYSDSEVESDSSGGLLTDSDRESHTAPPVAPRTRLSVPRTRPNAVIYSSPSASQDDWHDSDNYQSPVWASRWARRDSVASASTIVDSNDSRRPSYQSSTTQTYGRRSSKDTGSEHKHSYDISRQGSLDYSAMQSGRSGVRRPSASTDYERRLSYDSSRRGSETRRGSYDRRSSYDRPRASIDNPLLTRALGQGRRQSLEHFLGAESKEQFLQARRGSFDPSREFGVGLELGGLGLSSRRISVDSIGERERMRKLGEIGALNRRESEVLDLAIGKRRGGVYEIPADVHSMVARRDDRESDEAEMEEGGMSGGVYIVGAQNQSSHWSPSTVSSETESSNSDSGSGDSLSPGPHPPQELAHIELPSQLSQQPLLRLNPQPNLGFTFSFELENSPPLNEGKHFDAIDDAPLLLRSLSVDSEASSNFEDSVGAGDEDALITTGERISMFNISAAAVFSKQKQFEPPVEVPTISVNSSRQASAGRRLEQPASPDLSYLASCISIGTTPPEPAPAPPLKSDFRRSQSAFVSHRPTLSHSKSMPALALASSAAPISMPPSDRMATFLSTKEVSQSDVQQKLQYNRITPSRTDSNLTITGKRSASSLQDPTIRNAGTWEQPWMKALTEMQKQRTSVSSGSSDSTSPPDVNPVFARYEGQRHSAPTSAPARKNSANISPKSSAQPSTTSYPAPSATKAASPRSAAARGRASYGEVPVSRKRWESLPFEDAFVARTKAENVARQRLEEWTIPTVSSISHFSRPTPVPQPEQVAQDGSRVTQQQQQSQSNTRFSTLPPTVTSSRERTGAGPPSQAAERPKQQNRLTRMFTKVDKCM